MRFRRISFGLPLDAGKTSLRSLHCRDGGPSCNGGILSFLLILDHRMKLSTDVTARGEDGFVDDQACARGSGLSIGWRLWE